MGVLWYYDLRWPSRGLPTMVISGVPHPGFCLMSHSCFHCLRFMVPQWVGRMDAFLPLPWRCCPQIASEEVHTLSYLGFVRAVHHLQKRTI